MVKVKICGITNLQDALAAVIAGADALGFVFYRRSPRYIAPEVAREIIRLLPKKIIKAGVFVDMPLARIKNIAKACKLDILQFHGKETPQFCRKFKNYCVVKALRVNKAVDLTEILQYNTYGYLFDSYVRSTPGGTGKCFNWKLLRNIAAIKRPVFLSGGLHEGNVLRAIKAVRPTWVDASSSLERSPGKKDHRRIARFIKKVKSSKLQ